MTIYLLVIFLSIVIGATSVVLFAHGQGFWISFNSWENKSTSLFVWTRTRRSIFGRRFFIQGRLRYWKNTVLYRHDLALSLKAVKLEGEDKINFNAGVDACIDFLQSPQPSVKIPASDHYSSQTPNPPTDL